MTAAEKEELLWMILFVAVVGLVLIVTVILLMTAWRRHLERSSTRAQSTGEGPDIWKASGDRLIAQMSPFPKADSSHDDGGDGSDNDPNDDDDGLVT